MFTPEEDRQLVEAIRRAEKKLNRTLVLHVEHSSPPVLWLRVEEVRVGLGLKPTDILIYVDTEKGRSIIDGLSQYSGIYQAKDIISLLDSISDLPV